MRHHSTTYDLKPARKSRSTLALIGATIGFCLASFAVLPMHGYSVVGPWAIVLIGFLLGGAIGALCSPLFKRLFKRNGPLYRTPRMMRQTDPVSGMRVSGSHRDNVGGTAKASIPT